MFFTVHIYLSLESLLCQMLLLAHKTVNLKWLEGYANVKNSRAGIDVILNKEFTIVGCPLFKYLKKSSKSLPLWQTCQSSSF